MARYRHKDGFGQVHRADHPLLDYVEMRSDGRLDRVYEDGSRDIFYGADYRTVEYAVNRGVWIRIPEPNEAWWDGEPLW